MAGVLYNLALLVPTVGAALLYRLRKRWTLAVALVALHQTLAAALALWVSIEAGRGMFGAFGLLAWGVFLQAPLLLVLMAWVARRERPVQARVALALVVLGYAIAAWAHWVEPRNLEISHHRIESAKLTRPVRVVVLADLQTDSIGAYERRVLEEIVALEPDLLILTGDYIQARNYQLGWLESMELRKLWAEVNLTAPLGVYAVRGDVEPIGWEVLFEGLDVETFSETRRVETGELLLVGLTRYHATQTYFELPESERFQIVFGHRPDFMVGDVRADLLLAGHTHGGQVHIPFFGPPITFTLAPREWAAGGLHDHPSGGKLLVSRGVGMERGWAPRVRLLCRPELVVIELVPAAR